jgi:hypothetical protein
MILILEVTLCDNDYETLSTDFKVLCFRNID